MEGEVAEHVRVLGTLAGEEEDRAAWRRAHFGADVDALGVEGGYLAALDAAAEEFKFLAEVGRGVGDDGGLCKRTFCVEA